MTWDLAQTGASISGTLTMKDTATGYGARGSVSGTVSGSTVTFSLRVSPGGADGPWTECTVDVTGDLEATASSMTGEYSGSNSCSGPITSGRLTLQKR
jgi:hypothetical protein